ncbi:MAG: hypothetical protein BWX48_01748 [Verrucomicrobia bacterium ADurb.Bin006]|jgi:hypothetical protein|nr:MAG: hypothetical protein BWX48_01748 [Verrucomicrobia bacterium ADurb.Bin006]
MPALASRLCTVPVESLLLLLTLSQAVGPSARTAAATESVDINAPPLLREALEGADNGGSNEVKPGSPNIGLSELAVFRSR